MVVRWMLKSDIETVSVIREECSLGSRDFMKVLASPSCILKVAELDGRVAGFVSYKNGRKKIKILEFATTPESRRKGVACKLIRSIVSKASESSNKKIEVTIPECNLEAQMLLKKCGFKASKIVRSSAGNFYAFMVEAKCQKECS